MRNRVLNCNKINVCQVHAVRNGKLLIKKRKKNRFFFHRSKTICFVNAYK